MRSVVLAALFSVAATGALASDGTPAVVAAETSRPVLSVNRPDLGPQATRPVDTRLAAAPASTAADPLLLAAAPLKAATGQDAQAQTKNPTQAQAVAPEGDVSRGSLTAAALLMMAVVMIRRRGSNRML